MIVTTAYLGLGSNLGDRAAHLRRAAAALHLLDPSLRVSSLYESSAVGGPEGQDPYLNCVVELRTDLEPRELLAVAGRLESEAGRIRTVRNGPRTLDVDVLLYDDVAIEEEDLVIPHPRMTERPFVLGPLEELDAALVPSGWREQLQADLVRDLRLVGRLAIG